MQGKKGKIEVIHDNQIPSEVIYVIALISFWTITFMLNRKI